MEEDSLLERVTAAAEERQLSHNSLIAYRRTWLQIIAWAGPKASSSKPSHPGFGHAWLGRGVAMVLARSASRRIMPPKTNA